jgi:glycosyltransferase involved in cell wall biosynthesis
LQEFLKTEGSRSPRAVIVRAVARLGVGKVARRLLGHDTVNQLRDGIRWRRAAPSAPTTAKSRPAPAVVTGFGANVVGHLNSESGVGHAARSMVTALQAARVPVSAVAVAAVGHRCEDRSCADVRTDHPFPVNICVVTAELTPQVVDELGASYFEGKYNIGHWAWESEHFPEEWRRSFGLVDEVWVASSFVQEALAPISPVQVLRMPYSVELEGFGDPPSELAAIASDEFVFLFNFDYYSLAERKNPLAVVAAFRQAFGESGPARLVLKCSNVQGDREYHARLLESIGGAPVTVIDRHLYRPEMNALLQRCQAYVSLHRAEGFGLGMAEAMFLGKPVIATDYSGNRDFMHAGEAFLVPYRIVEAEKDHGPYRKGWPWADPDVDEAARLMRYVFEHPDEAAATAARGQERILRDYSRVAVGQRVRIRLENLRGRG